ncbi:MAG: caspase family protein [Fimbriimonadaceae bacterium]
MILAIVSCLVLGGGPELSFEAPLGGRLASAFEARVQTARETGIQRVRIVPQTSNFRLEDIEENLGRTRLLTHDRGYAPYLWDRQTRRLLRILSGNRGPVHTATFSADGTAILTASQADVRVWDSRRARERWEFDGRGLEPAEGSLTAAAISPDGRTAVVATEAGGVLRLRPAGGADESRVEVRSVGGHAGPVRGIAFSADGRQVATCSEDGSVAVWEVESWTIRKKIDGRSGSVFWVSFSGDGGKILASGPEIGAAAFAVADGRLLFRKPHHIGSKGFMRNTLMGALWIGAKQDEVVYAEESGDLVVVDGETGAERRRLRGHDGSLREIRKTRDGRRLATYGNDNRLIVWDAVSGTHLPFTRVNDLPTAGSFSQDGRYFLVGYASGAIREHDLQSGAVEGQVFGSVSPMYGASLYETPMGLGLHLQHGSVQSWAMAGQLPNTLERFETTSAGSGPNAPSVSPDGRRLLMRTARNRELHLFDTATGKWLAGWRTVTAWAWSPEGDRYAVAFADGDVYVCRSDTGAAEYRWTFDVDGGMKRIAFVPGGTTVVSTDSGTDLFAWDYTESGKMRAIARLDPKLEGEVGLYVVPDGSQVVLMTSMGAAFVDLAKAEPTKLVRTGADTLEPATLWGTSRDGKRLFFGTDDDRYVLDLEVGEIVFRKRSPRGVAGEANGLSPDGKRVALMTANAVEVYDIVEGRPEGRLVGRLELSDAVRQVSFSPDGSRILASSPLDGMTIWDARETASGDFRRLGCLIAMRDGGWLAMDESGRFDASDPADVRGAAFVLEWSEGLEAVDFAQLKSLFYEPGLLGKLLGADPTPVRAVPDLSAIRLYPSITLTPHEGNPMQVDVALEERDEGGIGQIRVSLNGKVVETRRRAGFFTVDLSTRTAFLLPETHLPPGRGNVLSVTATNGRGDLVSPPAVIDLGVPAGLRAPDVRLFALAVGVGDYAGDSGDLLAPSRDAAAIGEALSKVGERLLPGRIDLTVMTTAPNVETRPTRPNIRRWFEQVAEKATSADIVFVFLAGHGTSAIGDQKGYFFLTQEANPSEIGPAIVSTGTVSAEDLKAWLAAIPANKQVVILDTCHSGAAADRLVGDSRSLSGDYQRAWEAIRDTTGTWLLAGSAADQLSYESPNVEHGVLTYALLEAVDRATADGLRLAPSGDLFVDVERWLGYAVARVESLKAELGLTGIQRPQFRRSGASASFDVGVTSEANRGMLGLRPPVPVVIVGEFEEDKEDPAGLEERVREAMRSATQVKAWFDVGKHPRVYRIAGSYTSSGSTVRLRVFLQAFDERAVRRTLETFELEGSADEVAASVRKEAVERVLRFEARRSASAGRPEPGRMGAAPPG